MNLGRKGIFLAYLYGVVMGVQRALNQLDAEGLQRPQADAEQIVDGTPYDEPHVLGILATSIGVRADQEGQDEEGSDPGAVRGAEDDEPGV